MLGPDIVDWLNFLTVTYCRSELPQESFRLLQG